MIDEIEGLKIIVSGSSSFDILQQVGEPLTGRKKQFRCILFLKRSYCLARIQQSDNKTWKKG
jgi:hypothetical protein